MTSVDANPAVLVDLAESVAREAGAVLRDLRGTPIDPTHKSSDADWVSLADRAAEQAITTALRTQRPEDGLLAEEGTSTLSVSGYTWIIDPLDGTANYLRGYPGWAVSVAVQGPRRQVLAGVVHEPATGTTWTAHAGSVTLRDGQPVSVAAPIALAQMLVGTGFSYQPAERTRQVERLYALLPQIADLRRCGSAALELCRVADGTLDAFAESDLQPWDWAAGGFLVQRAGGVCLPWPGNNIAGLLAGPPAAVDQLAPLLGIC